MHTMETLNNPKAGSISCMLIQVNINSCNFAVIPYSIKNYEKLPGTAE